MHSSVLLCALVIRIQYVLGRQFATVSFAAVSKIDVGIIIRYPYDDGFFDMWRLKARA